MNFTAEITKTLLRKMKNDLLPDIANVHAETRELYSHCTYHRNPLRYTPLLNTYRSIASSKIYITDEAGTEVVIAHKRDPS